MKEDPNKQPTSENVEEEAYALTPSEFYVAARELREGTALSEESTAVAKTIENQESLPGDKSLSESVASNIARHVSNIKVDGSPLSNEDLLGSSMDNAVSEYAKKEGFSIVATDYAVAVSYFHSDAFRDRLVHSMGYENEADLSGEDRKTFDSILDRARSVSSQTDVYYINDTLNSMYAPLKDVTRGHCKNTAYLGDEAVKFGQSLAAHEASHGLYIGTTDMQLSKHMPVYDYLADSPSSSRKMKGTYGTILRDLVSKTLTALGEPTEKELKAAVKQAEKSAKAHDDTRPERAADVHGVRMQMLRDGLWNPFSGDDITPSQVKEYKEKHPDSRIFQYWDIKEATYYLNTIADNTQPSTSDSLRLPHNLQSLSSANFEKLTSESEQESCTRSMRV